MDRSGAHRDVAVPGAAVDRRGSVEAVGVEDRRSVIALARGVRTRSLSWHAQRPSRPGLVLGYAARTAGEIDEAVAVLGAVARELR